MLNFDKYREELLEEIECGKNGKFGKGVKYIDCFAIAIRAARNINGDKFPTSLNDDIEWLFSEYEPPTLENGDGLKPGDCIMVRNYDKENWTSQLFLCFICGHFVCVCDKEYIGHEGNYKLWIQARLPMEGE